MSDKTRFRTWCGRPGIIVRNFTPLDRNGFLGRGDLLVRAWHLVITGCLWRRLKNGRERIVFPHRAVGENGSPAPVVFFSTKQIEKRFAHVAVDAFRSAAAAHCNIKTRRDAATPARSAAPATDALPRIPKVSPRQGGSHDASPRTNPGRQP